MHQGGREESAQGVLEVGGRPIHPSSWNDDACFQMNSIASLSVVAAAVAVALAAVKRRSQAFHYDLGPPPPRLDPRMASPEESRSYHTSQLGTFEAKY